MSSAAAPGVIPSLVVVGRGRIGTMAADLALRARVPVTLIGRADDPRPVSEPNPGRPILVCTRNDDLDGLIGDVHPDNRPDLVFVQNGMLRPWLAEHGLLDNTQGLLYVAVPRVGARPQPGGDSVFWGPWAPELAELFASNGIAARALADRGAFQREIAVKFIWNAVLGLLGEATGRAVGEICVERRADVEGLCAELAPVLARALDVSLPVRPLTATILEYSATIPDYRASLKEWRWRNGWLVDEAAAQGVAMPRHAAWLARARSGGG